MQTLLGGIHDKVNKKYVLIMDKSQMLNHIKQTAANILPKGSVLYLYGSRARENKWETAANRLYYALFHAMSALLVCDGHQVKSHRGVLALFGDTR